MIDGIEYTTGLSIAEIDKLDFDDEVCFIKEKTGFSPVFQFDSDVRFMPRGSVLLAEGEWSGLSDDTEAADVICKRYYASR